MTDHTLAERTPDGVPAPPPDHENPALIDARKTFVVSVASAIVFIASALIIILRTRMG